VQDRIKKSYFIIICN